MILIGLPILLSIILTLFVAWVLYFFSKKFSFKITFLFSFAISYLIVSLAFLYFQYQQPASELFGIPIMAGLELLSLPLGIIPAYLRSNFFVACHQSEVTTICGIFQWLILSFIQQKIGKNKIFKIILLILISLLLLTVLLSLVFVSIWGKYLE